MPVGRWVEVLCSVMKILRVAIGTLQSDVDVQMGTGIIWCYVDLHGDIGSAL